MLPKFPLIHAILITQIMQIQSQPKIPDTLSHIKSLKDSEGFHVSWSPPGCTKRGPIHDYVADLGVCDLPEITSHSTRNPPNSETNMRSTNITSEKLTLAEAVTP